jgi:hypothetical protein
MLSTVARDWMDDIVFQICLILILQLDLFFMDILLQLNHMFIVLYVAWVL